MEGALPSVVGGLTGVPLVAVPTSVGYGASLGGVAALLAMLNSCAPGRHRRQHRQRLRRRRARRPRRPTERPMTDLWVDASSGASGDMLLGALVGAGVPLEVLQDAVDAVAPEPIALRVEDVRRGGLAATRVHVDVTDSAVHRTWTHVRELIAQSALDAPVRDLALAVFERLAVAEAAVHGTTPEDVHFHEVGRARRDRRRRRRLRRLPPPRRDVDHGLPGRGRLRHGPDRARHPAGAPTRGRRAAARCADACRGGRDGALHADRRRTADHPRDRRGVRSRR